MLKQFARMLCFVWEVHDIVEIKVSALGGVKKVAGKWDFARGRY